MNTQSQVRDTAESSIDAGLRAHMLKVYNAMSIGLLLTFAVSWAVGSSPEIFSLLRDPETLKPNMLGFAVMIAPLAMILFSGILMRMSAAALRTGYYVFTAVMGLSLSWIFQAYTNMSIAQVFLITAASFAGLSLWGYTTGRDISGWGSFLIMGVLGLILASIVNIFLGSPAIHFAVSILGVLIFAGLTAYDTQKIKTTYLEHVRSGDAEWLDKAATMGALELYLDFLNIFLYLLRLLGNRN